VTDWLTDGDKVEMIKQDNLIHSKLLASDQDIHLNESSTLKKSVSIGNVSFIPFEIIENYVRKRHSNIPCNYPPLLLEFNLKNVSIELVLMRGRDDDDVKDGSPKFLTVRMEKIDLTFRTFNANTDTSVDAVKVFWSLDLSLMGVQMIEHQFDSLMRESKINIFNFVNPTKKLSK
jgi:hypothetical protein